MFSVSLEHIHSFCQGLVFGIRNLIWHQLRALWGKNLSKLGRKRDELESYELVISHIVTYKVKYSHGHFWFVKNQFFWNFCFSVKDAEKFIKHHLFIYKRFTTEQNFKGVTQKLRLPRPWQVQNWPNYTMPFYYVKVPK